MGCTYCNRKKSSDFDNTLNPKDCPIEDEIEQRIDFANKKALFVAKTNDAQHNETIGLLESHPDANTEKAIKDELAIDKELLGFKYWIIRDTPMLYEAFAQDIIWNK